MTMRLEILFHFLVALVRDGFQDVVEFRQVLFVDGDGEIRVVDFILIREPFLVVPDIHRDGVQKYRLKEAEGAPSIPARSQAEFGLLGEVEEGSGGRRGNLIGPFLMGLGNEGNVCLVFQVADHLLAHGMGQRPHEGSQVGCWLVGGAGVVEESVRRVLVNQGKWNVTCTGAEDERVFGEGQQRAIVVLDNREELRGGIEGEVGMECPFEQDGETLLLLWKRGVILEIRPEDGKIDVFGWNGGLMFLQILIGIFFEVAAVFERWIDDASTRPKYGG